MTRLVWTLPDGQQTARWAEDEGGGGGSLPVWWTVDSTEGQESVVFAGRVIVSPTATEEENTMEIHLPEGFEEDSFCIFTFEGTRIVKVSETGQLVLTSPDAFQFFSVSKDSFNLNNPSTVGPLETIAFQVGGSPAITAGLDDANNPAAGFFGSRSAAIELARPSGDAGDLWDVFAAFGMVVAP